MADPYDWAMDPVTLRDRVLDPSAVEAWLRSEESHERPWERVGALRLLGRLAEAEAEAVADIASTKGHGDAWGRSVTRFAMVRQWQGRHAEACELLADVLASEPSMATRAFAWQHLGKVLAEAGHRSQGLVAVRTALALRERLSVDPRAVENSRQAVRVLGAGEVVPVTVGVPAHDGGGADPAEARALWVGAPADPLLAMLGWVERNGRLEVVRVVVPRTRRGRQAFLPLLTSLPQQVACSLRVPSRDVDLLRLCQRAGFVPDPEAAEQTDARTAVLTRPRGAEPSPDGPTETDGLLARLVRRARSTTF